MKGDSVDIKMKFREEVVITIQWKYLHVIYALLSLIKQFVTQDNRDFYRIFNSVESELRKKIVREAEADRFKLCHRCCKEIDTKKDRFQHTQFSDYEMYQHQECPPINQGKGYEK